MRDVARRALGEKAILDVATEMNAATRAELISGMEPGDRLTIKADGVDLGMVYVTDPKARTAIVDAAAFEAWVAEHAPGAIITRTITEVSPSWVKGVLAKGCTDDGEVPDGLAEVTGRPTLTVKPTDHAKSLARGLVQRELEP